MMSGKVMSTALDKLLDKLDQANTYIAIPPKRGIDAAGLKLGDKLFAVSTDLAIHLHQRTSVHSLYLGMNNVACLGAKPSLFTATLLLPEGFNDAKLHTLWEEFVTALNTHNVKSVGGHIEVTSAVSQPIMVGQMIGECIGNTLLDPRDCEPGDSILLWQPIGLEGTTILATEHHDKISQHFSADELNKLQKLRHDPGMCVWPYVKKLLPHDGIVALHDPTYGGVANALHELANNSQCGLHIQEAAIPILPETKTLCTLFGLEPLGLLATGALLIVCRTAAKNEIMTKLADEPICCLGELTANPTQRLLYNGSDIYALPQFNQDELTKLAFFSRLKTSSSIDGNHI